MENCWMRLFIRLLCWHAESRKTDKTGFCSTWVTGWGPDLKAVIVGIGRERKDTSGKEEVFRYVRKGDPFEHLGFEVPLGHQVEMWLRDID